MAGSRVLGATPQTAPASAGDRSSDGDLVARERKIRRRPRRRRVGADDQERPHRERRAAAGSRCADDRPRRTDGHSRPVRFTRALHARGSQPRATRRAASSERFRSPSSRKRSRGAPSRCRRVSSSPASAAGTTRNSPRRDGRRRRSWMPRRRRHAVYISGTGGGTGAITNSLGRTFLAAKGVAVDEQTGVVTSAAGRRRRAPGGADARTEAARHRRSERAREQPRPDRRHQRRQSPGSGVRAPALAPGQAHHPHAAALPGRLAAGGRGARAQQLQPVRPRGGRRPVQGGGIRRANRRDRHHVARCSSRPPG